MQVLVCEDNPISLVILNVQLRKSLKSMGCGRIDAAKTGAQALKLAKENKYDLIMLDIQLPDMNGWDIANEIRNAHFQPPNTIIVGVSAYDIFELDALDPFDYFLSKPITMSSLHEIVNKLKALK